MVTLPGNADTLVRQSKLLAHGQDTGKGVNQESGV
jgi:hypothetical protein